MREEAQYRCAIFYAVGDCVMPREGIFAEVLSGGEVTVGHQIVIVTAKA